MSKQSEAKKGQGYTMDMKCANCVHFNGDKEIGQWGHEKWRNLRCGIGGFAIKRTASCNKFEMNELIAK